MIMTIEHDYAESDIIIITSVHYHEIRWRRVRALRVTNTMLMPSPFDI